MPKTKNQKREQAVERAKKKFISHWIQNVDSMPIEEKDRETAFRTELHKYISIFDRSAADEIVEKTAYPV